MLDRSKDYGEVCGGNSPVKFVQNNKLFNAQGLEVDESGAVIEPEGYVSNAKDGTPTHSGEKRGKNETPTASLESLELETGQDGPQTNKEEPANGMDSKRTSRKRKPKDQI